MQLLLSEREVKKRGESALVEAHALTPLSPPSDFENWFLKEYGSFEITAISNTETLSYVEIKMFQKEFTALLDNGARVCIVNLEALPRSLLPHIRPTAIRLKAANGKPLHCSGLLTLRFRIQNFVFNHPFFVVRKFGFSTLLGLDFMRRYGIDILYSCNRLQIVSDGRPVSLADIVFTSHAPHPPGSIAESVATLKQPAHPRLALSARTADGGTTGLVAAVSSEGRDQPAAVSNSPPGTATGHDVAPLASNQPTVNDGSTSAILLDSSTATQRDPWDDTSWIYSIETDTDPGKQPVYSKVMLNIPPLSKILIPLSFDAQNFTASRNLLFETNPKLRKRHHLIARESIIFRSQKFLPVTNISQNEVILYTNIVLGWLTCDFSVPPLHSLATETEVNAISVSEDKIVELPPPTFDINPKLNRKERKMYELVLKRFQHCFVNSDEEVSLMREVRPSTLHVTDEKVIRTPQYRLSPAEFKFLKKHMQGLETGGLISRTDSPYRNPIMVTRKTNGDFKAVWDYRRLNKILKDVPYDALCIESLVEKIHSAKVFCVLDFKLAYLQVPIDEESKRLTAFQLPGIGTFQFEGLPIGIKSAPGLFQHRMDVCFGDLRDKFSLLSYFDDNLLCAQSVPESIYLLHEFLSIVDKFGISISSKKCKFGYSSCTFLGQTFQAGTVRIPDSRLEKIRNLQPPKDSTGVQSLCGFFNHFRKFVTNYSHVAYPLTSALKGLPKKCCSINWTAEQQTAFETVRDTLLRNLPLYSFDPDLPTFVHTDASHQAAGACISQLRNECPKPVVCELYSKTWSKHEKNWEIFHKEFAAAAMTLKHFRHRLLGKFFTLYTDSQPLTYWATMKNPEGRLAKFCMVLSQYDFKTVWIKGSKNCVADCMSRLCPTVPAEEENFEQVAEEICQISMFDPKFQTIPDSFNAAINAVQTRSQAQQPVKQQEKEQQEEQGTPTATETPAQRPLHDFMDLSNFVPSSTVSLSGNLTSFPTHFRSLQDTDPQIYEIINKIDPDQSSTSPPPRNYSLVKGLLSHKGRLVIPQCLRYALLHTAHDLAGHHGQPKTLRALLDRQLTWPSIHQDVVAYCSSCELCQATKHPARPPQGLLRSLTSLHPFDLLALDYCGNLTPSGPQKFTYILLITDCFTHFTFAYRTKDSSTETTVRCLKDLFMKKGLCRRIIHDDATYFTSKQFQAFLSSQNIIQIPAPRYAHWVVGIVESRVHHLKALLVKYSAKESAWAAYLPLCMFFINSGFLESIGTSPFRAMHGFDPLWPLDLQLLPPAPMTIPQLQDAINLVRKHVVKTWKRYSTALRRRRNKNRVHATYTPGQKVRVYMFLRRFGMKKFKYLPSKIISRLSKAIYLVKCHRRGRKRIFPVHVRHIAPFIQRPAHLTPA